MIRSRLGWLNTVAEPQSEQKTKAAMEIEVVQEKHNEGQVQNDDQQNQELPEPPEDTRSTEKENVEKGKGEKNVSGILVHIDVMEIAKDEKEEIGKE